jgi:hypothetical protein
MQVESILQRDTRVHVLMFGGWGELASPLKVSALLEWRLSFLRRIRQLVNLSHGRLYRENSVIYAAKEVYIPTRHLLSSQSPFYYVCEHNSKGNLWLKWELDQNWGGRGKSGFTLRSNGVHALHPLLRSSQSESVREREREKAGREQRLKRSIRIAFSFLHTHTHIHMYASGSALGCAYECSPRFIDGVQ